MDRYSKRKSESSSRRASWGDYDQGRYFVTVCTKNRSLYLGRAEGASIVRTEVGEFLYTNILNLSNRYPRAVVHSFVVMPNHFHLFLSLAPSLGAILQGIDPENHMRTLALSRGYLSVVIGGLKSATTKWANERNIEFGWQPRFNDVVVRGSDTLDSFINYIDNNPKNWQGDELYCD